MAVKDLSYRGVVEIVRCKGYVVLKFKSDYIGSFARVFIDNKLIFEGALPNYLNVADTVYCEYFAGDFKIEVDRT